MLKTAFVLAAGKGERLRPLTESTPKPLLPLGKSTVLSRTFDRLEALGFERVVVNVHYLKAQLMDFLRREADVRRFEIISSVEEDLLGTGGGLKKAAPLIGPAPFLMVNGDIHWKADLGRFVETALSRKGAEAVWALSSVQGLQTPVSTDSQGRLSGIGELWRSDCPAHQHWIYTGIQVVQSLMPSELPVVGCLVRDYWIKRLNDGARIDGVDLQCEEWEDLGTPEKYQFWHRRLQKE